MKTLDPQTFAGYIPANTALFSTHELMLMPWVKDLKNFVVPKMVTKYSGSLHRMDIPLMSIQEVWDHIKQDLPKNLSEVDSNQYLAFLRCLAKGNVKLDSSKVAPNGNGVLCHASSLFDHEDSIFLAAFRVSESAMFLDPSFRASSIKDMLAKNGLRRRSGDTLAAEDFLQCILAIKDRWQPGTLSETFFQDSKAVAGYVCWDKPEFRSWPQATWDRIFRTPMFRVEDSMDRECVYRQAQMRQIAQRQSHNCLSQVAHAKYKSILWSQVAFLKSPPADFVLQKLQDSAYPSVATVFDHLVFLISICMQVSAVDLPEYLKDIQASYDYLQTHEEKTSLISGIREVSVWINLDTTDINTISALDIQSSLAPAQSLCMHELSDGPFAS